MDPSVTTSAYLQYFEPETEFKAQPPQQTTSTSPQALDMFPQIKAEPAYDTHRFGQDPHADGHQVHTLQHQVKVEDEGGEGQQGGYICEICGLGL